MCVCAYWTLEVGVGGGSTMNLLLLCHAIIHNYISLFIEH